MTPDEEYVRAIAAVAGRDASIGRVLREICSLDSAVRASALELVAAHLRTHGAAADVLQCVDALRDDGVARALCEQLGPPGSAPAPPSE